MVYFKIKLIDIVFIKNVIFCLNLHQYVRLKTTVESLYEPFEISNVAGNVIVRVEDNPENPETAIVFRNRLVQHRFQQGFNYIFPDD